MANYNKITTYYDFVQYCLKKLGAPVINIELADEQIIDRITDGLQFYLQNNLESVQNSHWIYKVTTEDEANQFVQISPEVIDVMEVSFANKGCLTSTIGFDGLDDPEFMYWDFFWRSNQFTTFNSGLIDYELTMQEVNNIKSMFKTIKEFKYRPLERKLSMYDSIKEGDIIIIYGSKMLDPETDDCIWDSAFLKAYCTALLGKAWGTNITKFGNVPNVGGSTLNGEQILARYTDEVEKLEEKHKLEHQEPPLFFFG